MRKFLLALTLPFYVLDQWTKWLIVSNFPDAVNEPVAHRVIEVIPDFSISCACTIPAWLSGS